jgi:hypothetical protein
MIGPTDLFHPSPAPHFKTFQLFLIYCPQRQVSAPYKSYAPNVPLHELLLYSISNLFYFGTTLYMFRAVFPSVIRRSRLYIQQQVYVRQVVLASKQAAVPV